jgi:hypothetical protein
LAKVRWLPKFGGGQVERQAAPGYILWTVSSTDHFVINVVLISIRFNFNWSAEGFFLLINL